MFSKVAWWALLKARFWSRHVSLGKNFWTRHSANQLGLPACTDTHCHLPSKSWRKLIFDQYSFFPSRFSKNRAPFSQKEDEHMGMTQEVSMNILVWIKSTPFHRVRLPAFFALLLHTRDTGGRRRFAYWHRWLLDMCVIGTSELDGVRAWHSSRLSWKIFWDNDWVPWLMDGRTERRRRFRPTATPVRACRRRRTRARTPEGSNRFGYLSPRW
jgi:hypothetical protein